MNILMMSNTYTPIVGGLEKSVQLFSKEFRNKGHRVYIVAPRYENSPKNERRVIRVPALQKFQGTDFSVNLPIPGLLTKFIKRFKPDIVHSHHPFLVGDMALRLSRSLEIPLVFTYHIMFEQYIDYLPIHNETFKHFVVNLAAGYSNLCDAVIVPTQSVKSILESRGVTSPMYVIPTGIDIQAFGEGNKEQFRKKHEIPADAFVIGYTGRIAPEKNLEFLTQNVVHYLKTNSQAHFLMAGTGPLLNTIKQIFNGHKLSKRFHYAGVLNQSDIIDCYHAMDIFAFSSHSETQGIVLLEAMAAGVPILAVQDPVVSTFIKDYRNGRCIHGDNQDQFIQAMDWFYHLDEREYKRMKYSAQQTANSYSILKSINRTLKLYHQLIARQKHTVKKNPRWNTMMNNLKIELNLLKNFIDAGEHAVKETLARKSNK